MNWRKWVTGNRAGVVVPDSFVMVTQYLPGTVTPEGCCIGGVQASGAVAHKESWEKWHEESRSVFSPKNIRVYHGR